MTKHLELAGMIQKSFFIFYIISLDLMASYIFARDHCLPQFYQVSILQIDLNVIAYSVTRDETR